MRNRQGAQKIKSVQEVHITINNQISNSNPKKINIVMPETSKLSELKD
jgi:hypothetical protein